MGLYARSYRGYRICLHSLDRVRGLVCAINKTRKPNASLWNFHRYIAPRDHHPRDS
jgi:hypothetical protein